MSYEGLKKTRSCYLFWGDQICSALFKYYIRVQTNRQTCDLTKLVPVYDLHLCFFRCVVDTDTFYAKTKQHKNKTKQNRYWLLDAASYYFDHAVRLGQHDFCPTDEDVIMTRVRTTGIDTTEFAEPPYMYSVVDVGGQRNERRKWIHCFDNVKVRRLAFA